MPRRRFHGAIEKFRRRFTGMEDDLSAQGKSVGSVSQASWSARGGG